MKFVRQILRRNIEVCQTNFDKSQTHFQKNNSDNFLEETSSFFRHIVKLTIFRRNFDILQTNFENNSDTFSVEILTFHRQILRTKNQTNFLKKMIFLRHILIKSQTHFQEYIVLSKICLIFFSNLSGT